jgi:hypothetical protein
MSIYIAPVSYYIGLNQGPPYKRGKQVIQGEHNHTGANPYK